MKKIFAISINSLSILFLLIILYGSISIFKANSIVLLEGIIFISLFYLLDKYTKKSTLLICVLILISIILKILWIYNINSNPISDFGILFDNISMLSKGIKTPVEDGQYLFKYPHWKMHTFFYTWAYSLLKNFYALYYVNALFILLSQIILVLIIKNKDEVQGNFPFYIFLSAPFIFFSKVIDPQIIALTFFLSSFLIIKSKEDYKFIILSGILISIGNSFRGIGIFFLAGSIIYLLYKTNPKKFLKKSFILVISFLMFNMFLNAVVLDNQKIEKNSNYILSSISVGLNSESHGMWNKEDNERIKKFENNQEDLKEYLIKTIKERTSNKKELLSHLIFKHSNMWKNSDFASISWSFGDLKNEDTNKILITMNHYLIFLQSLYLYIILRAIKSLLRGLSSSSNIYSVTVFTLLMCLHTLIEVQGRYAYIIFPMILIIAMNETEKSQ